MNREDISRLSTRDWRQLTFDEHVNILTNGRLMRTDKQVRDDSEDAFYAAIDLHEQGAKLADIWRILRDNYRMTIIDAHQIAFMASSEDGRKEYERVLGLMDSFVARNHKEWEYTGCVAILE